RYEGVGAFLELRIAPSHHALVLEILLDARTQLGHGADAVELALYPLVGQIADGADGRMVRGRGNVDEQLRVDVVVGGDGLRWHDDAHAIVRGERERAQVELGCGFLHRVLLTVGGVHRPRWTAKRRAVARRDGLMSVLLLRFDIFL